MLGTINANVSGQTLTINGVLTSNAGMMEATGGGVLNLTGSPLTNAGTVKVDAGSTLQTDAAFTQTGGKTQVNGTMLAALGENVSGGSVMGTGTINGNYEQSTALYEELINGSGNGLLIVNGTSTLGSGAMLDVSLFGGFTPFSGETFTLMDFISGSDVFANAPSTGFQMDGFNWTIDYSANKGTSIVLDATSPVTTTPTPEPSSIILMATGLAALFAYSFLRKGAAAARP